MSEQPDLEIQLIRNLHSRADDDEMHEWFTLSELCETIIRPINPDEYEQTFSTEIADVADTVESLIERSFIEKERQGSVYDVPFRLTLAGELFDDTSKQISVDSSRWTGLKLDTRQTEELVANVRQAISCVDGLNLSQEKKSQVRALLSAALTLSEAPDPPLDIIAQLLGNADRIIGIAGLFLGIAGLLVGFVQ